MSQSTQSLHESLSAAVDGEAQELELRRVLNAVQDDAELGGKWERLHLIRSAIRGEATNRPARPARPAGLDRPWLAEAAPERALADASRPWTRWLGPLTGGAVAAAAALVVVVYLGDSGDQPATQASVPGGLAEVPTQRDLLRANSYLLQHAQHTSVAARPVALPFAKVLTTEDGRLAMPVAGPAGNDGR